ncbi:NADH-dependent phenylglyoxylate dehydrogenase subunit gamma [Candidatus Terasakiella magnetica]|nr:NADH-dependent phenylglyoxylate dehydrogenase subunit gamma [Candidatus Terasakiella magnetica]
MTTEIRLHGRGGQGTVMAAGILAQALAEEGKWAIAIPTFGFERRGAPVSAFLRVDDKPIRSLTNIYHPDVIVCIDPTVSRAVDIFAGIAEGATLVLAGRKPPGEMTLPLSARRLGLVDAVAIAMELFKRPITNSVMLGALARTTGIVSLAALRRAMEDSHFRDAGLAQNLAAIERGYDETQVLALKESCHAYA